MEKKTTKKLVSYSIVFVFILLLAGLIFWLVRGYFSDENTTEQKSQGTTTSLISYQGLSRLSYVNDAEELSLQRAETGRWQLVDYPEMQLAEGAVTAITGALLQALDQSQEPSTEVTTATAGLTIPQLTIDYTDDENQQKKLLIGQSAGENNYFAKFSDEQEIFTVGSLLINYLNFDQLSLVATPTLPVFYQGNLLSIRQTNNEGSQSLTADNTSNLQELAAILNDLTISTAIDLQPIATSLMEYGLTAEEQLTYEVIYLSYSEEAEESDESAEELGSEQSFTFNLGKLDEASGGYFIMVPDNLNSDVVFLVDSQSSESLQLAFNQD
ncbi:DUF4340 domain-containing protein [Enterococcus sp. LJL120]